MITRQRTIFVSRVVQAVAATLAAAAGVAIPAAHGATLSVQREDTARPQVRSVQRDASDNEQIAASAHETVEVLLADGTSLTLSPGSRLVIERYRYDRASRIGELQLRVESGAVRIVGGALNNSSAVIVKTPSGSATLDNAVAYVRVTDAGSEFALVAGRGISVQGTVETRSLAKSGMAAGLDASGVFGGATRSLSRSELQAYSNLLNPGLESRVVPTFVVDSRVPAASAIITGNDTTASEDGTAKDDKFGPVLPDPVAPVGACSAGGCTAGAPNFDLASSIGNVANRQSGYTTGATWRREYQQGELIATQGIIRGFAPDFTTAVDGRRDATARIFAGTAGSPYSVTFGAANPATSAADLNTLTCFSDACRTSPIVSLYNGLSGPVYRVAGIGGGEPANLAQSMHLIFPDARMQDGGDLPTPFGASVLLADIPFDLNTPGVLFTRSVNSPITGCAREDTQDCRVQYFSAEERDDAFNTLEFLGDYAPQLSPGGGGFSLFSSYTVQVLAIDEPDGGGGFNYFSDVVFTGQTAYDISSLQTGFRRVPIRNHESDMARVCFLGTFDCDSLAASMFGDRFPGDNQTDPQLNRDSNPNEFDEVFSDVIVRDPDSFLALDMVSRLPGDNQRLFYSTGSVSGRLPAGGAAQGATLDTFRLSAGLDAAAVMGRAFLRPETLLAITPSSLLSSQLLVMNAPYTSTINTPSRALHYDFAAVGNGTGQTSTISVTLGTLTYNAASTSAQLAGRTVGSIARAGTSRYSGSVQSALLSTTAGGGNPNIANTGRAGYLVLENYDPATLAGGGLERTIENGGGTQTTYANLRVGQIAAGGSQAAPANRADLNLTGYAGGFAEITGAGTGAVAITDLSSTSFQLVTSGAQGTAGATLNATLGDDAATLNFGSRAGANGLSAYTGAKEFAAMTALTPNVASAVADAQAANAAIVSGAPLVGSGATQGWTADLDAATRGQMSTNAANSSGYRYLQWGFFFGDFNTADGASAHAHLTSWVAGRATPEGTALPTGTAEYTGHVFANVSNGAQLYSAAGTFANQWNFATRAGTGTMSFDGGDYSFVTRLLGLQRNGSEFTSTSTSRFEGLISTASDSSYIGSMNGGFVADPTATTDPLGLRAGVMGQFNLSHTRDGNPYRAVGTFAGERQGP